MSKPVPTLSVTVDGNVLSVEHMSAELRGMVELYDEWQSELYNIRVKHAAYASAVTSIQTAMIEQYKKEQAASATAPAVEPAQETPAAE